MGRIITLTGPSASGKSTLERHLVERGFKKLVSYTTRNMRAGEKQGVDYRFVDIEDFLTMKGSGLMVESVEFNGNHYGLSKSQFKTAFSQDKPVVVVAEPTGALQINNWARHNGHINLRCFVGGDTKQLIERFISREAENGEIDWIKLAERLESLTQVEAGWVNYTQWDAVFDLYTEASQQVIIDWVCAWVSKSQMMDQFKHLDRKIAESHG